MKAKKPPYECVVKLLETIPNEQHKIFWQFVDFVRGVGRAEGLNGFFLDDDISKLSERKSYDLHR